MLIKFWLGVLLLSVMLHTPSFALEVESVLDETDRYLQACEVKSLDLANQREELKLRLFSAIVDRQQVEVNAHESFEKDSLVTQISTSAKGIVGNSNPQFKEVIVGGDTWVCAFAEK